MSVTTTKKYLVAPNGTVHLRKPGTQKSWCGRVNADQDGVTGTNKAPEQLCGRDVQLSEGAANKAAETPVKASAAAKGATGTRKPRKSATTPVKAAEAYDEKLYTDVDAFLTANDSAPTYNNGPDGLSLSFEFDDWTYSIWAPEYNASGPDEGWVITYRPADADSGDESTLVDDELPTVDSVIRWIASDTGMTRPRKTRVAKPVAEDTSAPALVTSHLVTIVSNAASAATLAKKSKMPAEILQALTDLKAAADSLRKTINSAK